MAELEADLEDYLKKLVTTLGGLCIKIKFIAWVGAPDRLIILPGGHVGFMELKRPDGKGTLSKQQGFWLKTLTDLGVLARMVWRKTQVHDFLRELGGGNADTLLQ